MEYLLGVDEGNPIEYLLDDYFDLFFVDFVVLAGDELLEVLLVVVEHYLEHLLLGLIDDVKQGDDVGVVLQGFEEGDLSQCAGGDALLFALEFYVFHCNRLVVFVEGLVDSSESALADLAYLLVSLHLPLNSK